MTSSKIPYARQSIDEEDIRAVAEALRSDFLTQGPRIAEFEREIAAFCGVPHAVAVCNATAALHLAALAAGVGPGKRLWTVPNTFVASANCGLYTGAEVDFCDIDPRTLNLDPRQLRLKLKNARAEGRLPTVVIPVHFGGAPCDLSEIRALAREYGFSVIEDASHALGARWSGGTVGCAAGSLAGILSFHPVKMLTTGEGGMVLTHDASFAQKIRDLRTHGITRDPARLENANPGPWEYEQQDLGYNYRITDLQCALGLSQLRKLGAFVERRQRIAERYRRELAGLPLAFQELSPAALSSYHLFVIQVQDAAPLDRRALYDRLHSQGILVNVHYMPVHRQPYYARLGFRAGQFPVSEDYASRCLSLPMYASLTDGEQGRVIAAIRAALS